MPPIDLLPDTNRLLEALPVRERQRFLAGSRPVELALAEVLTDSGDRIRHIYFPTNSFISLNTPADGYAGLDVGLIGDEGMLGIDIVLGVEVSPLLAVVQGAGPALRMDAALFRRGLLVSPALRRMLKRYAHVLMSQLAQSAACTRYHLVQARLARLLLMTQDRAHSKQIQVTHEVLAGRLGVRRAGVTAAATALQRRALISYRRGDITVLDRVGLKNASCSCYAADNSTYVRMMGIPKRPGAMPSRAAR